MAKLTTKIAIPIILAGLFAITVFIALDYQELKLNFYIVLILLAVYVFFFGFATGQSFVSPIRKLLERTTQLSEGDFSSRVYIETKDELSDLARSINKIAEELEQSRIKEQAAEKSVDIKVRARTQELEETINALEQKIKNRTIELERMQKELEQVKNNARAS